MSQHPRQPHWQPGPPSAHGHWPPSPYSHLPPGPHRPGPYHRHEQNPGYYASPPEAHHAYAPVPPEYLPLQAQLLADSKPVRHASHADPYWDRVRASESAAYHIGPPEYRHLFYSQPPPPTGQHGRPAYSERQAYDSPSAAGYAYAPPPPPNRFSPVTPVSLDAVASTPNPQLRNLGYEQPGAAQGRQATKTHPSPADDSRLRHTTPDPLEQISALDNATPASPWYVPHSESEAPLFAKPEHLRKDNTLEHVYGNMEMLLTYFPREVNGLNLALLAEDHSDALIARAINAARDPGNHFTEEQVRKEIGAAFILYSPKVLPGSDPILEVQTWGHNRRHRARRSQLRDVIALPKQEKAYFEKAVFNHCMVAIHEWIAENDCPTWLTDRLNGLWHRAAAEMDDWWQSYIEGAKSLKDTLSILSKWVNAGHGDAGKQVAELWNDVMDTFANEWRKGEIERYAYLADYVQMVKEWRT